MPSPTRKPRLSFSSTHLALLRGINVGGKHILPMADLVVIFEKSGCTDVRTYIQSGNVVFAASPASIKRVPLLVTEQIVKRFGFEPHIMLRSGAEIAAVAAGNPLPTSGIDPRTLQVGFLRDAPHAKLIAALDPKRSPDDTFAVRGREIYVHYPNGVLKTRFTGPYIDSVLKTSSTFRNWRTVLKLTEMANEVR